MNRCTCSEAEDAGAVDAARRAQPEDCDLVTIDHVPYIGETPRAALQSWLTPNANFYVRNHFSVPSLDSPTWSLSVEGEVTQPFSLTLDEVMRLPKHTVPVTLECAGNNRSDLQPEVSGNQFRDGAVGTAIWGGLALKHLLESCGVTPAAKEVLFEAADTGEPEPGKPPTSYQRSLSLTVATHPDTLLAYEMNGEQLPEAHGYPLRLIVPSWYGMASVKWLNRIVVIDYEFRGFFQTDRYVLRVEGEEPEPLSYVWIKSLIGSPRQGDVLDQRQHEINGLAWSGGGTVTLVEFSPDSGETWRPVTLGGPDHPYTWRPWSYHWEPLAPGHFTLMVRAYDEVGNMQPLETTWNSLGYAVNGVKAVCVTVRD